MIYIFIVHPAYKVYFALLLYRSSTIAIIRTYRLTVFTKCLSRLYCKTIVENNLKQNFRINV